ncbi:hypothetical protein [Deinococcus sp. UR1]|uniref:hypothetical protein n=1 Tax=Deinococcus sp. UR1 TaxID=1704277 RepID=UPI000AB7AD74|nr:hypothetical protein [Deinococcus sp. UR1]
MFGKILRGAFGQPKDLPEQFSGDSYEAFVEFLGRSFLAQTVVRGDTAELRIEGRQPVKITRFERESLLVEFETQRLDIDLTNTEYFDPFFAVMNIDGKVVMARQFNFDFQGDINDASEKLLFHISETMVGEKYSGKLIHFRPYLNGKTYGASWQAFAHFMKEIKGDRVTSEASNYISFDTGGLPLGLQKSDNSQEIIISYDLRDYEGLYDKYREQILELINGVALRHRQICFLIDRERLLICNKFYVSPETDALNLFTAQLQAMHDALLDYLTTVQEAPEHAWLRAAREVFVRGQPLPRA